MQGDVLLIVLALVVGIAAFFFGIIYMAFRAVAFVGRGVFKTLSPPQIAGSTDATASGRRTCMRASCEKVEVRPDARYCGRCGAELVPTGATSD